MPVPEISDDILDFLNRRVDSVPHLEALLLFWENPEKTWTSAEIAARVYVSRDKARTILEELARHGFIEMVPGHSDGYRYQPAWDEAGLMHKVAATYRQHLVYVAGLIHARAGSTPAQEFARAFKFKNKE
jgi:hypothetical protein